MKNKHIIIVFLIIILLLTYFFIYHFKKENYMNKDTFIEIDKVDSEYKRLLDAEVFFQDKYKEIIKIIIKELSKTENPNEFFINIKPTITDLDISFEIIHQNTFKTDTYLKVVGNGSGKDRKAIFNLKENKISFLLFK